MRFHLGESSRIISYREEIMFPPRARVCMRVYARALYICLQLALSCECYYHKLNTSWSKRRLGVADKPMTSGAATSEIINLLYEKRRCRNRNAVPTDLCGDNYRDRYLRDHLNSIQYPAVIHRSSLAHKCNVRMINRISVNIIATPARARARCGFSRILRWTSTRFRSCAFRNAFLKQVDCPRAYAPSPEDSRDSLRACLKSKHVFR
jgi:hypothetical protein